MNGASAAEHISKADLPLNAFLPLNGASAAEHISKADLPLNAFPRESCGSRPSSSTDAPPRVSRHDFHQKRSRQVRLRSAQKQSANKSRTQTVTRPAAPLPTNNLLVFLLPAETRGSNLYFTTLFSYMIPIACISSGNPTSRHEGKSEKCEECEIVTSFNEL